jgi:alcohol dehydrogenase
MRSNRNEEALMKAAVLNAFGSPLAIETVPEPLLGTGEVIVDVVASRVLAYANEVLSGERKYLLELPVVPGTGAIGRIRATGPDATRLRPGDWVYCDPTVRSRDNALSPDIALQGLTAGNEAALRLQRYFHDGAWAEQMRLPTENAVPIGDIDEKDAARWSTLGPMAGSSPRNCKPERSCWSMAPPAASAAPLSPSHWEWGHNAWSRPDATSRR